MRGHRRHGGRGRAPDSGGHRLAPGGDGRGRCADPGAVESGRVCRGRCLKAIACGIRNRFMALLRIEALPSKATKGELLRWLAEAGGIDGRKVGKIELAGGRATVE